MKSGFGACIAGWLGTFPGLLGRGLIEVFSFRWWPSSSMQAFPGLLGRGLIEVRKA